MEVRCLPGRNQNCHPARPPLSARDLDIGSPKHSVMSFFRPRRICKNGRSNALHNRGSSYVGVRYTHTQGSVNPELDHGSLALIELWQTTKVKALGRCSLASLSKEEEEKKIRNHLLITGLKYVRNYLREMYSH